MVKCLKHTQNELINKKQKQITTSKERDTISMQRML